MEKQKWISVLALSFAALIFNLAEFIPIALLTDIGKTFHQSAEEIGIVITLYAWVVAITSLPLMIATKEYERRRLLLTVFIIFTFSNLISVLSANYYVFIISRFGVACAHAIFWSITPSMVMRIAPKGKVNKAFGLLSLGVSLAAVIGMPLGKIIGNLLGWKATFFFITLSAAIIGFVLSRRLPKLPATNTGSLSSIPILFKRFQLVKTFIFTILIITAHFSVYSYIEPFTIQYAEFTSKGVSLLLLFYGTSGFLGSYLFGKYYSQFTKSFFIFGTLGIILITFLLKFIASSTIVFISVLFIWGLSILCITLSLQTRILHLAKDATDVALSIHSGLYNVGIGGGALIGSIISKNIGLENIGFVGTSISFMAFFICLQFKYQE